MASLAKDVKRSSALTSELGELLPKLEKALKEEAQRTADATKAVESRAADAARKEAALEKREKALEAREAALAAREAELASADSSLQQRTAELKQREAKVAASPPPSKMDSLSMQVLVRATATALLKTGIQQQSSAGVAASS